MFSFPFLSCLEILPYVDFLGVDQDFVFNPFILSQVSLQIECQAHIGSFQPRRMDVNGWFNLGIGIRLLMTSDQAPLREEGVYFLGRNGNGWAFS